MLGAKAGKHKIGEWSKEIGERRNALMSVRK